MPDPAFHPRDTPHAPPAARVGVRAEDGPATERADRLAAQLGLPRIQDDADEVGLDAVLVATADQPSLREARPAGGKREKMKAISCDFVGGAFGHRVRTGHVAGEVLVKAVQGRRRERQLTVVDATAGLGRDAALLALAGFNVTAIERSPIIAALLQDGLRRAAEAEDENAGDADRWTSRLTVVVADARTWLTQLDPADQPDVVTLDPMFPSGTKSALVKKEMRLCRLVAGGDDDAADLLTVARQVAQRRVVVKRPPRAAPLGNIQPTTSRTAQRIRYDIYAQPQPQPQPQPPRSERET